MAVNATVLNTLRAIDGATTPTNLASLSGRDVPDPMGQDENTFND